MKLRILLILTLITVHTNTQAAWRQGIAASARAILTRIGLQTMTAPSLPTLSSLTQKFPLTRLYAATGILAGIATSTALHATGEDTLCSTPQTTSTRVTTEKGFIVELQEVEHPAYDGAEVKVINTHFSPFGNYLCDAYPCIRAQIITAAGPVVAGVALYTLHANGETRIHHLVVTPEHRDKGIGKALINYVCAHTHCRKISLRSIESARSFYIEKAGFTPYCSSCELLFKKFEGAGTEKTS